MITALLGDNGDRGLGLSVSNRANQKFIKPFDMRPERLREKLAAVEGKP